MQNRVITIETTKAYAKAFNEQDVAAIADLLDDENVIFSRQEQSAIVGKDNVLRRIRNLFWRADEQNYALQVINAIVDLGNTNARPCLISLRNGVPVALCVLSCKVNGKVSSVTILLSGEVVASARPTEPMPGQEDAEEENEEQKRADVLALTKEYVVRFNNRDMAGLGDILDDHESVFTRSDQQAVIGKHAILARVQDLYSRLEKHGQKLQVVSAIIDYDGKKTWPCTLGYLDETPISVGFLTLLGNGKIATIDIILTPDIVALARPTEELKKGEPKKIDLQQVLDREEWLIDRMNKIKRAMASQGNLPHLVTKLMSAEKQMTKIEYLKKKLS